VSASQSGGARSTSSLMAVVDTGPEVRRFMLTSILDCSRRTDPLDLEKRRAAGIIRCRRFALCRVVTAHRLQFSSNHTSPPGNDEGVVA
jgi:hypothetical protein